ncbi:MAG TPA: DJ-1/PfpI family protein [Dehalococcoidia bacterium]|nr:DJ-1/PfpI family protein [Dehalococcoidia bacterium]
MEIAIVLFDGITALDAIGPYEVLTRLPGAEVKFAAKARGLVRTDNLRLGLSADYALDEITAPEILLLPGGLGTRPLMHDPGLLEWIRGVHRSTQWTTSVCTGALLLAAAGLLEGLEATTHWLERETLARYGARPVARRVVRQGKIITAAGVSSGIDMALTLANEIAGAETAQAIQLAIEYDPQPPFDAGSPEKAPPAIVQAARAKAAARAAKPAASA